MIQRPTRPYRMALLASVCWLSVAWQPGWATLPADLEAYRLKGLECEKKGQWADACACYDKILKADHHQPDIRERYQTCLRHALRVRRHRDPSLQALLQLPLPEALTAYEEVLRKLQENYVEKDRSQLSLLFRHGVQELVFALEDERFLQEYLPTTPPSRVRAFAADLQAQPRDYSSRRAVREQVRRISLDALDALGLNPTVAVLEFAAGACHGLDEYTAYLTPAQLSYVQAALKGEFVGVGIEADVVDGRLTVTAVAPGSGAEEKGVRPGDRILRLDGQAAERLSADVAAARLLGKVGTAVEVVVTSADDEAPRAVKLLRQALFQPSVERAPMAPDGVGYVRLMTFQESTPQELKDAILSLQAVGMKVLVLDLRGNPGGLLTAAVQAAEMFLQDGTILITESPVPRFRKVYKAKNSNALTLPVVVLVDGATASAAEVLAGALKERGRATLVGTPTLGKGCVQCVLPLETTGSGVKITVMKFFSPTHQAYHGRGVVPDVVTAAGMDAAWQQGRQLALMLR